MRGDRGAIVAVATAVLSLAACGGTEHLEGTSCPPGGTDLTYESFGQPFLDDHCQRCHAENAGNRNGAPAIYVFDTRDDVIEWQRRIFARAAASNTSMPPGPDGPGSGERELLAEWLACGAP